MTFTVQLYIGKLCPSLVTLRTPPYWVWVAPLKATLQSSPGKQKDLQGIFWTNFTNLHSSALDVCCTLCVVLIVVQLLRCDEICSTDVMFVLYLARPKITLRPWLDNKGLFYSNFHLLIPTLYSILREITYLEFDGKKREPTSHCVLFSSFMRMDF